MGTLLIAGATLLGCSKSDDTTVRPADKTAAGPVQYVINLSTSNTKAIVDPGDGTLTVTWKAGDEVSVENLTTKTKYAEKLVAESDGASTTLKGTFSQNFNIGDELELTFIGQSDAVQTGLLNSTDANAKTIENTFDYAIARIEVKEIEIVTEGADAPKANVFTTDANFERQQSIVKFTVQNRKETPVAVQVKDFHIVVGASTDTIHVHPTTPLDVLYVAMPAFEAKKLTLMAEGNDGFSYKLISPEETLVNGEFYTRTVQMKRLALVEAPVAKTGLAYNGTAQALVDAAQIYWMVNEVKTYVTDEEDKDDAKSIISYFVKKEVTAGTVPDAPAATAEGWVTTIPTETHAGTYYVWTKMTGNYDYESVDVSESPVPVTIAKATPTVSGVTATSTSLTYNGSAQSLLSAGAKLMFGTTDVTSAKDASNAGCTVEYYVSTSSTTATGGTWGTNLPTATNAGTHYVWVKVTGNGDMKNVTQAYKVSKAIAKKTPSFSLSSTSVTFATSDDVNSTKTVNVTYDGDGALSVSSGNANKVTASISNKVITLTRKDGGAATVTITVSAAAGTNYSAPSNKTISVTLTETDCGVALKSAQVGYKVASNGKAYPANATLPSGATLEGVIVKSGVVMKAQNQGTTYNRENARQSYKHVNAEAGYGYYINNLTEAKTTKNWILGDKSEYVGILGNAGANINSIQTLLSAAGADPLTTGDLGYVTWCYEEDNYFKINAVGTSNFVSYNAWNTGGSTGRYARLIFFY
jgi:hypothetical protein